MGKRKIKCSNCGQEKHFEYIGYDYNINKYVFQCKYCMFSFDTTKEINDKLNKQIEHYNIIKSKYICSICNSKNADYRVFQGGKINQVEGIYCDVCWNNICYELS